MINRPNKKEDTDDHVLDEETEKLYKRFSSYREISELPISPYKNDILETIKFCENVCIITAPTGAGKTTRVPQYIFEDCLKSRKKCNVIITQPRRIAAVTVAKRVALEMGCEMGMLVGYKIGLDQKMDNEPEKTTRILYCTTGTLLQKLISKKTLNDYSHIISRYTYFLNLK